MKNIDYSIPATFMRGGTSKGIFFLKSDLPFEDETPNTTLDKFFIKLMGSPDPYGQQMDGLGGGSSSTSKVVIIDRSQQPGHDADYLFGQVSVNQPLVDWSGNCGNLTAAAAYFSVLKGLISPDRLQGKNQVTVRLWQKNIGKTIDVTLPLENSTPKLNGHYRLDGVTFPSPEIKVEFLDPIDSTDSLFPTGNPVDKLDIPDVGLIEATLINAGIPCVFVCANDLGLEGTELQPQVNSNQQLLKKIEKVRTYGALKMGLISSLDAKELKQHTPKIAFVAPAQSYTTSSGDTLEEAFIDVLVRAVSMGKLHHALMATCAVAASVAAEIPETLVNRFSKQTSDQLRIGHPSGVLNIKSFVHQANGGWQVKKVAMSRSARLLMDGRVFVSLAESS